MTAYIDSIRQSELVKTFAYDALLLVAMHTPVPKFASLVAFAGTAYSQSPRKAVVYTVDALALYGLISVARNPLCWTSSLRIGGAAIWGFKRLVWRTETFQRWFNRRMRKTFYAPPAHTEKKPDIQDGNTARWDKDLKGWPLMLELVDDLPEPTNGVTISELLKRDLSEMCGEGLDMESRATQQFWVDVRQCLQQDVAIGDEELLAWQEQNPQRYCLLNRSEVLKEALAAEWATGRLSCHSTLLSEEQKTYVRTQRDEHKLPSITRADSVNEQEWMRQMLAFTGMANEEQLTDFMLGQMDNGWIAYFQAFGRNLGQLPKPQEDVELFDLLTEGQGDRLALAMNPLFPIKQQQAAKELAQFVANLQYAWSDARESVTIGDELTDWALENPDVYCLINRPAVLTEVLCSEWATGHLSSLSTLLSEEQKEYVREQRDAHGLPSNTRADSVSEQEQLRQMLASGGEEAKEKYMDFILGKIDDCWIGCLQWPGKDAVQFLPKPQEDSKLFDLLTVPQDQPLLFAIHPIFSRDLQYVRQLAQFVVNLKYALSDAHEAVTIGDELTDWLEDNEDVYCLINRPAVLTEALCSEWVTCKKIQVEQRLFNKEQLQRLQQAGIQFL